MLSQTDQSDHQTESTSLTSSTRIRRANVNVVAPSSTPPGKPIGFAAGFVGFYDSRVALNLALVNFAIYLGLGVLAFCFLFEKWTVIDALYFGVVTFTTIGYGDLHPTTDEGRLFTIFFALYGIGILGLFLGVLGEKLVETHESMMKGARRRNRQMITNLLTPRQSVMHGMQKKQTKSAIGFAWNLVKIEAPIVGLVLAFALMIGHFEKWSFVKTIYYGVISATTVGYGDVAPSMQSMRCFCVLFLPLAVAVFCEVLGRIAGAYVEYRIDKREQAYLARKLTARDLEAMDASRDGKVSWGEFLVFMLKAMDKVEEDDLVELRRAFDRLDKGGDNALDRNDLVNEWKKNTQIVAKELDLPTDQLNGEDDGFFAVVL